MGTISPTRLCLPDAQKERRNLACGTGAGDDRGHLWLARFAYGLFLPEMRESLDLSETALGYIGAGSYAGYCLAIVVALVFTSEPGRALWCEGLQDRANALINSGTIDKPILQHTATPRNRHRRTVAPKDARACHWPCCRTVAVARPDTTLIPPAAQYGATRSKAGKGNPSKYAVFANPCNPLQCMTDHSYLEIRSAVRVRSSALLFTCKYRKKVECTARSTGDLAAVDSESTTNQALRNYRCILYWRQLLTGQGAGRNRRLTYGLVSRR
jgi:hypothetical protein